MSKETIRTAYAGALSGTVFGLALVVVSLVAYLVTSASYGAAFFLIFTAFGAYILFWGLIGLLGARLLKNQPLIGAGLLLVSAIGGCLLGYSMIAWAIPAFLEIVGVIMALKEVSKKKKLSRQI